MPQDPLTSALINRQPDAMDALQKAQTIGAPQLGEHYVTDAYSSPWEKIASLLVGSGRPRTLQVQDPFGTQTFLQGKGPAPMVAMGTTDELTPEAIAALSKSKPAAATFIKHLMDFANGPVKMPAPGNIGAKVPPPLHWPTMLNALEARIPEAEGLFTAPNKVVRRAEGLPSAYLKQLKFKDTPLSQEQRLTNSLLKGAYDRIAVSDPSELQDVAKLAANKPEQPVAVTNTGTDAAGVSQRGKMQLLEKAGLTPDDVKDIRNLSLDQAVKLYPNVSRDQLYRIKSRDVFGWIR